MHCSKKFPGIQKVGSKPMANLCIIHFFENRLNHLNLKSCSCRSFGIPIHMQLSEFTDMDLTQARNCEMFTLTAFRLRIMKFSALRIINVINLLQSNFSIPSTCLIVIETRREFIDGSMKTLSLWLRDTITDSRSTSEELFTSTSGLLWRSIFWELKFSTHMDACRVRFTARK